MRITSHKLSGFIFAVFLVFSASRTMAGTVVDFKMAEKTIDWLTYMQHESDTVAVKDYFMTRVAPTAGCRAIIHHWERFKKWDNEEFYAFIKKALAEEKSLWRKAAADPEALRRDLSELKKIDLARRAEKLARRALPADVQLENNFYVVVFGASSAFSVGGENGFDLLQLPRQADGHINAEEVLLTFAHEMHHTGFNYFHRQYEGKISEENRIMLAGILAAEGSPTFYVDRPMDHLKEMENSNIELERQVAAEWEQHSKNLPDLYAAAQADLQATLQDSADLKELFPKWMGGAKGAAYVLGADMYRVIETYSGRDRAMEAIRDYRLFLKNYNRAAVKANSLGKNCFVFDTDLAARIAGYRGPALQ